MKALVYHGVVLGHALISDSDAIRIGMEIGYNVMAHQVNILFVVTTLIKVLKNLEDRKVLHLKWN